MHINLAHTTATRQATILVEPNGTAFVIPHIKGAWIAPLIGLAAGAMGAKQEREAAEGMRARALSPEEREIIDRMEELAMGDEELGQRYRDITVRSMRGESVSPGLEKDIAATEERREERIRGLGTDISATAVEQARTYGAESADVLREDARTQMAELGQQLMASRTGRMARAAGTALAPLAEHRGEVYGVESEKARRKAGARAGLVGATAQTGAQIISSRGGE